MAVSLNSVIWFNSTLQAKHRQHYSQSPAVSLPAMSHSLAPFRSTSKTQRLIPSVADSDRVATDTNQLNDPVPNNEQLKASSVPQPRPKRSSPLTARERLKAARVLSRYPESKTTKPDMGKKVLDALRESDKGKKRSRLPEAPTNMLDDAKRGMPNPGWTFDFPGGNDLLVIAFSFVFISTVMFATTFVVWKVGAIHFNEF
ncbi:unnamed protein product [Linum tenue]|uniref:Uncharacterized protein n=1 Tax=Linum tenue TaxID=586396 RepID=A0AAV0K225_9ROSI|nr:unnamed protein product [Linum tenue]